MWYGVSGIAKGVQMGDNGPTLPNSSLIGVSANQTTGWQLTIMPEPTTSSLLVLGSAALLISRRRKSFHS
jgi:hypothetical protein